MQKQTEFSRADKNKYPQPVTIVIVKDKNAKANPVTVGWTMPASGKPPMVAVALAAKHHSTDAIRHSKCFTIAYPTDEMADAALFFGSRSGKDTDKFAEFDCKTEPAKEIDSLLLTDADANLECTLESETTAGDHVIFVGKVVTAHVNTEPKKRLFTIGPKHTLGPVS